MEEKKKGLTGTAVVVIVVFSLLFIGSAVLCCILGNRFIHLQPKENKKEIATFLTDLIGEERKDEVEEIEEIKPEKAEIQNEETEEIVTSVSENENIEDIETINKDDSDKETKETVTEELEKDVTETVQNEEMSEFEIPQIDTSDLQALLSMLDNQNSEGNANNENLNDIEKILKGLSEASDNESGNDKYNELQEKLGESEIGQDILGDMPDMMKLMELYYYLESTGLGEELEQKIQPSGEGGTFGKNLTESAEKMKEELENMGIDLKSFLGDN